MESKFLNFKEVAHTGINLIFNVESKSGTLLGQIGCWYTASEFDGRYKFSPTNQTTFDASCLTEISNFIDNLMLERKLEKQNNG